MPCYKNGRCADCGQRISRRKRRCGSKKDKTGCAYAHSLAHFRRINKQLKRKAVIARLNKGWKKEQRRKNAPYAKRQRAAQAKYAKSNRPKLKLLSKLWRKKNRKKILFNNAQRRLRKKGLGRISLKEWENIKCLHAYKCAICGIDERELAVKWAGTQFTALTQDHIRPLSKLGRNDAHNVQPACISCSARKRDIFLREQKPVFTSMQALKNWRAQQVGLVVAVNGVFDILHIGHVEYILRAKALGAKLVVGVNSDAAVRKLKGPTRPIHTQEDRASLVAALEGVDAVCIFDSACAAEFLAAAKPDTWCKGSDYTLETLNKEECRVVRDAGGAIRLLPLVAGVSTTLLVAKIAQGS